MSYKHVASNALHCLRIGLTGLALFQFTVGGPLASSLQAATDNDQNTTTPIKHVIVIIGENRSFDHVFATYVPKPGEKVWNLLSEGIVTATGAPGPHFAKAEQTAAFDEQPDGYLLNPSKSTFDNSVLPAPLVGGPQDSYVKDDNLSLARQSENGLPSDYYAYLVTGGTGQTSKTPDARITNVSSLKPGPFQLTNGDTFTYNSYAASPVHRFYQMWQQLNCSADRATSDNPSGCNAALFPWVEATVGAGTNGVTQPANFSTEYGPDVTTTGEGSSSMGFYNMQNGDAPYFKHLADEYSMSDNFHQSVNGGTGANHIMLGHSDMIYFSDGKGHAAVPPHTTTGTPNGGLNEIENPNPAPKTNNWYMQDGYGGGSFGSPAYGGGSYSDCSDTTQPGVAPSRDYLKSLHIDPRCQAGHYYLLNNYNPGYFGQGENAFTDTTPFNTIFTVPPSSTPSIGDDLTKNKVSWVYFGDQWNNYAGNTQLGIAEDKYQLNYGPKGSVNELGNAIIQNPDEYCNICNPFQYDTSIMTNATSRAEHIQDTANLYTDIQNGTLPAVSIVKPSGIVDGHPASSKLDLFEGFVKKIVDGVHANPELWNNTAIFITEDEGG